MALVSGYRRVVYRFQGLSLHCWMTALEMLMQWRYGNIYGVNPGGVVPRGAHTGQVLTALAAGNGFNIRDIRDYGLRETLVLTNVFASWQAALRAGGPILLGGNYGPSRLLRPFSDRAGHVVLVVGTSGSNKLAYYDPFLIGMKAIAGNHCTYMSPTDAINRMTDSVHVPSALCAAEGGADRGIFPPAPPP